MESRTLARLIGFLKKELAIPDAEIQFALKQSGNTSNLLPMILWQYGLVTIAQLNQIFDWLEKNFFMEIN
ncbi:MAG: DUF2949 domain-containing protein [Xenococcaceae cyanobacterium]